MEEAINSIILKLKEDKKYVTGFEIIPIEIERGHVKKYMLILKTI